MPDENRFSGLGDVVEDEEPAEGPVPETDAETTDEPATDTTDEPATDTTDEPAADTTDEPAAEPAGGASSSGGPAFEFEDTTAKSVYVRPETLSVMDDAEFEVESLLRRDHDVRDLTGREFHDALVRVAADHPDDVAAAVLAVRDGDDAARE